MLFELFIFLCRHFNKNLYFSHWTPSTHAQNALWTSNLLKQNINANIWNEVTVKQCWNLI